MWSDYSVKELPGSFKAQRLLHLPWTTFPPRPMDLFTSAALLILGSLITLGTQVALKLFDRDTHASNKVLELRLEALQLVQSKLADALRVFGPAAGMGWERWQEEYGEEAQRAQGEFRLALEQSKMLLDAQITRGFRQLDTDLLLYRDGDLLDDDNRQLGYARFLREHYRPHELELETAVNRRLDSTTHRVELVAAQEA